MKAEGSKFFLGDFEFSTFFIFSRYFLTFPLTTVLKLRLKLNIFLKIVHSKKCWLVLWLTVPFSTTSPLKLFLYFQNCRSHTNFASKMFIILHRNFSENFWPNFFKIIFMVDRYSNCLNNPKTINLMFCNFLKTNFQLFLAKIREFLTLC
jgi:hypothetical protein